MNAYASIDKTVKAGDIIGHVGNSGRATSSHLHYEARINDQPVNPTTVALPTPKLDQAGLAAFREQQKSTNQTLALVRNLPLTVAQID